MRLNSIYRKKYIFLKSRTISYNISPYICGDQWLFLQTQEWLDVLKFDWLKHIFKLKVDENRYETTNRMYSGDFKK